MKKQKGIYILLCVLAAMIVFYIIITEVNESNQEKESKKAEAETIKITNIEEVSKFSYTNGTDTMSFIKDGDEWKVEGNTDFPLSQYDVDYAEGTAAQLTAVRKLKENDQLSDYGLTAPQFTISLTDEDGKVTTILIGNTTGEDYYAMVDGEETVYTISSTLVSTLKFSLDDMIELETFPTIGQSNLKNVTITQGDTITKYSSSNDDDEKLSTIAGGFGSLAVEKCISYNADETTLASYGLSETDRTTVEVVYKDNDTKEKTTFIFYVGHTTEDGSSQYIQMDGSKMVNQVSAAAIKNVLAQETQETEE